MAAAVSISKQDACARSEASYAESATSTQADHGVPLALANLVRRTLPVSRRDFERLQAQERACRLQGNHRCCAWWLPVLPPSSPLFAWWSLLVLLLDLTYTAVACPVTVAFAPRGAAITWAFILDFVAGLLFTLDVCVQLHVGWHITHGMRECLIMRHRLVTALYVLRGSFAVDLCSSLAWFAQVALLVLAASSGNPGAALRLAAVVSVARLLRVLRVLRVLKRLYLDRSLGASERLLGLAPHTLHLLQLLYVAAITVNLCGCLWYLVAREAGLGASWVAHYAQFVERYSPDGASPLTAAEVEAIPAPLRWLAAIYFASTTMLTVGYGDIVPWSTAEMAVCVCIEFVGVCFTGALLGSVAAGVQRASKASRRSAALGDKLAGVEGYLRGARVPRELRRRVRRHYGEAWAAQESGLPDAAAFYAELPAALRADVAHAVAGAALAALPCFRAVGGIGGAGLLRAVSGRLEPLDVGPGCTLCEEGDEAAACWVLQEGWVCVSQGALDGVEEEERVEGPALLGEAALLGPELGHPCQPAGIRTITRCRLWRLRAADLAGALRCRPQALETIQSVLLHGTAPCPGRLASEAVAPERRRGSSDAALQIHVDARSWSGSAGAGWQAAAAAVTGAAEPWPGPGPPQD